MDVFEQDELVIYHHPVEELSVSQTYGEVVKDLIMDEKQYLRDLQVIRKQKFCGPDPMLNFLALISAYLFVLPSTTISSRLQPLTTISTGEQ